MFSQWSKKRKIPHQTDFKALLSLVFHFGGGLRSFPRKRMHDRFSSIQDMEQKLAPVQDQVNRIHPKKTRKPKDKRKPKPLQDEKKESACQFCGMDHKGPSSNCPLLWKNMWPVFKKGSFRSHVLRQKEPERPSTEITVNRKVCPGIGTGGVIRFRFHLPGQGRQTLPL